MTEQQIKQLTDAELYRRYKLYIGLQSLSVNDILILGWIEKELEIRDIEEQRDANI